MENQGTGDRYSPEVRARAELAADEHADIISAIEKRNADRAEQLARKHIRMAEQTRLAMMFDDH